MNVDTRLCSRCSRPILTASKSGKCRDCRQLTGGAQRPTAATVRLVYVIGGSAGPVKIGVSTKPQDRLAQICAVLDRGTRLALRHLFPAAFVDADYAEAGDDDGGTRTSSEGPGSAAAA